MTACSRKRNTTAAAAGAIPPGRRASSCARPPTSRRSRSSTSIPVMTTPILRAVEAEMQPVMPTAFVARERPDARVTRRWRRQVRLQSPRMPLRWPPNSHPKRVRNLDDRTDSCHRRGRLHRLPCGAAASWPRAIGWSASTASRPITTWRLKEARFARLIAAQHLCRRAARSCRCAATQELFQQHRFERVIHLAAQPGVALRRSAALCGLEPDGLHQHARGLPARGDPSTSSMPRRVRSTAPTASCPSPSTTAPIIRSASMRPPRRRTR